VQVNEQFNIKIKESRIIQLKLIRIIIHFILYISAHTKQFVKSTILQYKAIILTSEKQVCFLKFSFFDWLFALIVLFVFGLLLVFVFVFVIVTVFEYNGFLLIVVINTHAIHRLHVFKYNVFENLYINVYDQ